MKTKKIKNNFDISQFSTEDKLRNFSKYVRRQDLTRFIAYKELFEKQINNNFDACMLTAEMNNPSGYGRIIRDENGDLKEVKEDKDCNDEELQIKEINSGIYIFDNQLLFDLLPKLDNSNAQSEYYLPDVLSMIIKDKGKIGLEKIANIIEIQGVNTTEQLLYLEKNYEKYVL